MNTPNENPSGPEPQSTHAAPTAFTAGQKLAGVFVLRRQLEALGSDPIWLAHDEVLGKDVSLQFLPPEIRTDDRAMAELRQEIKRHRQLIHPGIVRIYDLVEEADWAAISMDYFDGEALGFLLSKKEGQPFEPVEIEPWLKNICHTLDEVHRIQVIHRNICPDNVWVDKSGKVMLARFGISRVLEDARGRLHANEKAGERHLTYVSPQQLDGEPPTRLDDVYALGATIFELTAGEPPFVGPEILAQIRRAAPGSIADRRAKLGKGGSAPSAGWEKSVASALAKAPAERPQTAAELASKLGFGGKGGDEAAPLPKTEVAEAAVLGAKAADPKSTERASSTSPVGGASAAAAAASKKSGSKSSPAKRSGSPAFLIGTLVIAAILVVVYFLNSSSKSTDSSVATTETASKPADVAPESIPSPEANPPVNAAVAEKSTTEVAAQPGDSVPPPAPTVAPEIAAVPAVPAAPVALVSPASSVPPNGGAAPNETKLAPAPTATPTIATNVTAAQSVGALPAIADHAASSAAEPSSGKNARKSKSSTPTPPPATPPPAAPSDLAAGAATADDVAKASQAAAAAEHAYQAKLKEKQEAESAAATLQHSLDEKTKAAAPVLKTVEALSAEQKQREEQMQTAEAAAREARKAADEQIKLADKKAREMEDAKTALTEWRAKNKEKLAGKEKIDAELQKIKDDLTAKQKIAAELAKTTSDAEAASKAQAAALKRVEAAAEQAKLAAAEAARMAEAQRAQQRDQIKAEMEKMKKDFEEKMKALQEKMLDGGPGSTAPASPAAAPASANAPKPPAAKSAVPAKPQTGATAKPVISLPAKDAAGEVALKPPVIADPPAGINPALPVVSPDVLAMNTNPKPSIQQPPPEPLPGRTPGAAFENSLGIRFAPVGDVFFAVWPVRVQDYDRFAKETNLKSTGWRSPGFKQGQDHPVVNVSWNDSIAFCKWLTESEHKKGQLPKDQIYRLPTDLEWSRAVGLPAENGRTPEARDMGIPDVFPWGTQWPPPPNSGNYTGEETGSDVAIKGYDDGYAWTSPVGSFPANKLGLFDMGGNVWQWCMDSWNPDSKAKVLRGASWYNGALKLSLLSSCRVHANPDSSTDNYGFRIVRATDSPKANRK